jgi:lysozyme
MLSVEVIDNCPVPSEIAPMVRILKHDVPGAIVQSCYRGGDAEGLLKRLGKHAQPYLYWAFTRHLPGFFPANRPGTSTHERRSDGKVYRGPVGRVIKAWGVGIDWGPPELVGDVVRAAHRRGWALERPYHTASEAHHTNFLKRPRLVKKVPAHLVPAPISAFHFRVSEEGVKLVAGFEGLALKPYRDVVGVWTVGYGHTGPGTPKLQLHSAAEARALLRHDLQRFELAVHGAVRVPVTQHQFDALVSLAYNIGADAFAKSTLVRRLNARHYGRAANQFRVWNQGGGRVLAGLVRRRAAERALFLAGSSAKTRRGAASGAR